MPFHHKARKKIVRVVKDAKKEYEKSKSRYKYYQAAPKLGQKKINKIAKSIKKTANKPKFKKFVKKSRTASRNIENYFTGSAMDFRSI